MEGPLLRPLPWWRQRSGGLTMGQTGSTYHNPVMVREVVDFMEPVAAGIIVDGTFGGGGHALALLDRFPEVTVIGIDRDPDAIANAPVHPRLSLVQANFAELMEVVAGERGTEPSDSPHVDGVLLDLGISSHQVDTAERGFSFRRAGPLDMRMGPDTALDASELVNEWDVDRLTSIFRDYGEERFARRIARAIVAARPVDDTEKLAAVVADAIPAAARRPGHPARRIFQALRIAVNDELGALAAGLDAAIEAIRPGGRVVVISYHSLEDRLVKQRFAAGAAGRTFPPDLPVREYGDAAELRLLGRTLPSTKEIEKNPRARSAVLRAAEKVTS